MQGNLPRLVLDVTVFSLNSWTLDHNVLWHGSIIPSYSCLSFGQRVYGDGRAEPSPAKAHQVRLLLLQPDRVARLDHLQAILGRSRAFVGAGAVVAAVKVNR